MELTADDVKYSIMRTLDPHLKPAASWGEFSEPPFVGASDFIAGKTKDVPGIQVLGPYTIRFVLTQPTALFPYIMAESFNMVVPKAVVSKESEEAFNNNPIGTGPYILQSWTKGSKVVFVHNKHYIHTGKPYIDKIIVDLNTPSNLITLKIQKGEISGFGRPDQMSAADLQQVKGDPEYANALVNQASTTPLGADRDALLRQAQRRILQAATMIPLIYVKSTEFVSPKVSGYYYLPLFGWQYEYYWLNP